MVHIHLCCLFFYKSPLSLKPFLAQGGFKKTDLGPDLTSSQPTSTQEKTKTQAKRSHPVDTVRGHQAQNYSFLDPLS